MRSSTTQILRPLMQAAASVLLLGVAGCAVSPTAAQIAAAAPPIPAGQARVWFYRPLEPYESLNLAGIDMNGTYVGSVANGSAIYRDVAPGPYHIAPDSWGRDINQDTNVSLVPGQQLYIKIVSLKSWAISVSGSRSFQRDTFYAWQVVPEVAQAEIGRGRQGI